MLVLGVVLVMVMVFAVAMVVALLLVAGLELAVRLVLVGPFYRFGLGLTVCLMPRRSDPNQQPWPALPPKNHHLDMPPNITKPRP